MNEKEAAALVAFANQNDARVQANASTFEVWHYALGRYTFAVARAVIVKHYASVEPVRGVQAPPLDPMTVKRGIGRELERAAGQRSAVQATRQRQELEAPPDHARYAELAAQTAQLGSIPE